MQKQTLNGEWQFRQCGTDDWLPAAVPGGVHTDLLALGKIPDPFVADNELKVMWVVENDWEYRRNFNVDAGLLAEENVVLVCDGLDTIADLYLNGTYLGHAENMFRRWEWDVKPLLKEGGNELLISFGSPVCFITSRWTVGSGPRCFCCWQAAQCSSSTRGGEATQGCGDCWPSCSPRPHGAWTTACRARWPSGIPGRSCWSRRRSER